jgi:hypothetical protein
MAGSALIYLAAMDITFNVQHGLYKLLGRSGPMVAETAINFTSLILGIVTLAVSWKRSAHSDAAH